MANRGQEADEGAPRVPDEVRRAGVDRPQERDQVIDVREHLIVHAGPDVFVWPRVAAAVCDRAVRHTDRRELLIPAAQIAGTAVDEDDRLAGASLAVGERRPIDRHGLHRTYRATAHRPSLLRPGHSAPGLAYPGGR